jgi:hypothetical protein
MFVEDALAWNARYRPGFTNARDDASTLLDQELTLIRQRVLAALTG